MSERLLSLSDDDLAAALSTLDIEWPPAPMLSPAVMARAGSERHPSVVRLPLSRTKRVMLIAAATVLLLAGAAVAAKIVIDLGAVVVDVVPSRPGLLPTPRSLPPARPSPCGTRASCWAETCRSPNVSVHRIACGPTRSSRRSARSRA